MAIGQSAAVELELAPFLRDRTEPLQQGRRFIVEVDEDQIAEAFTANGAKAATRFVQSGEVLGIAIALERPIERVRPGVIFANQAR